MADDMFGKVEVYGKGSWQWIFENDGPIVKASVNFQGCRKGTSETPGMCFMPETVSLLTVSPVEKMEEGSVILPVKLDGYQFERKLTGLRSANEFISWLQGKDTETEESGFWTSLGFFALAGIALLGGLGLNLTPCVLPMIPINLAIIGAGGVSGRQGFLRGLCYGAGMACSYGILGLAVILAGARFGTIQSSMYFNFAVALVFLLLALASAGVFNLDFSGVSAKIRPHSIRGGKEVTAFVMGCVAALLAGACVAPVVVSVLLFASARYQQDGSVALLLPFLLGIGMALPWPLAGAGLAVLPKPGKFMVGIKYVFAALIFCAALWYAYTGWQLRPRQWNPEEELRKFDAALSGAARNKKDVIIDFQASWCKNCTAMKKVLAMPEVADKLKHFQVIDFRAESFADPRISALLKQWNIPGLPAFVLLKYTGR